VPATYSHRLCFAAQEADLAAADGARQAEVAALQQQLNKTTRERDVLKEKATRLQKEVHR
jgi:hypothetical protein